MVDGPRFPDGDERTVARYWHVQPGHKSQPGLIWAGIDPGSLFKSEDGGKTWQAVDGINNHPTRDSWSEGAGGIMVHTVVQDPGNAYRNVCGPYPLRVYLGVMTAGPAGSQRT